MNCNKALLQQLLAEQLSETQESQLAQHLNHCHHCREALERMAGEPNSWQFVEQALRHELSSDSCIANKLTRQESDSRYSDSDLDALDSHAIKPSDFIVDYLEPSECQECLGRIGRIEIRQFIGQGAHGIVLKGYQPELNRLVAVKLMAPHLATVVAARKRFAREARAAAAIVHPNIMPILQVDSSGQLPYLVMPYLNCQSLQQRIDAEGFLHIEDALRIAVQLARGLSAAHSQGVVHRDVKPANILLEHGLDRAMLTDFGLARAVDDATLTRSGLIAGTPHYMSPEQARGDAIDARSDLFSLGSVLYAMLTGRPPFRAETTYGILRRVTDDVPRPLHEFNSSVPGWLEALVEKMLSKAPEDRIQSADEVATLLQDCLNHCSNPSQVALPSSVVALTPANRRHFAKPLLILFGLTAILGVTILLSSQAGLFRINANQSNSLVAPDESNIKPSAVNEGNSDSVTVESQTDLPPVLKATDLPLDSANLKQKLSELEYEIDQLLEKLEPTPAKD